MNKVIKTLINNERNSVNNAHSIIDTVEGVVSSSDSILYDASGLETLIDRTMASKGAGTDSLIDQLSKTQSEATSVLQDPLVMMENEDEGDFVRSMRALARSINDAADQVPSQEKYSTSSSVKKTNQKELVSDAISALAAIKLTHGVDGLFAVKKLAGVMVQTQCGLPLGLQTGGDLADSLSNLCAEAKAYVRAKARS